MRFLKRLRDRFFKYEIADTYLEKIAPGEYKTKHIRKYRLRR